MLTPVSAANGAFSRVSRAVVPPILTVAIIATVMVALCDRYRPLQTAKTVGLADCKGSQPAPLTPGGSPSSASGATRQEAAAYVDCREREAETTLAVEVTIPGVIVDRAVFGLRRAQDSDDIFPSLNMMGACCRDGEKGWCDGGSNVLQASAREVRLLVGYGWGGDAGKGEVREELAVPMGGTLDVILAHGTHVVACFRKPWPAPSLATASFFIKELAGPDTSRAIWELVEVGEPVVPLLQEAIKDSNALVRASAVWALGHVCAQSGSVSGIAGVLATFDDPDMHVRENAVCVCRWINNDQATAGLTAALRSPHQDVVLAAHGVLCARAEAAIRPHDGR